MAFTYKAFVDGVADMTVTGVTRKLDAPPDQLNTADMPVMYPRLPSSESGVVSFGSATGLRRAQMELAIVIDPNMQATTAETFATALTLMDNLTTALESNAGTLQLDEWQLEIGTEVIGESEYWLVLATVLGSGT